MYIIKQVPEDFKVKELISLRRLEKGKYAYFLLEKKNLNTLDVIDDIASLLRINKKQIGFAGNKDKKAVSQQFISIYGADKERISRIKLKSVELKFAGYGGERINLGDNAGNEFLINVRNLDRKFKKIEVIKNYFDEQRFGASKENPVIGKEIVKKDFKGVCESLGLEVEGRDYTKALRKFGVRRLRFYLHAYQAYIFNKVLERLDKKTELALIGFLSEIKDKDIKKIYDHIMKEEGIKKEDFIIRSIPELSFEGSFRKAFVKVEWISCKFLEDELNKGKFKQELNFRLEKGSYATMVVKQMFK